MPTPLLEGLCDEPLRDLEVGKDRIDPPHRGQQGRFPGANEVADYVLVGAADLPTDWTLEVIFKAGEGGASQGLIGGANTAVKAEQWNDTMSLGYTNFGVVDVTLAVPTPSRYTYIALVGTEAGVDAYVSGELVASDATTMPLSRDVLGGGHDGHRAGP